MELQNHVVYGPPQFSEADVLACLREAEEEEKENSEEDLVKKEKPDQDEDEGTNGSGGGKAGREDIDMETDGTKANKNRFLNGEENGKCSKCKVRKTRQDRSAINDPLGQIHNPADASSDHYSRLKVVLFCKILKVETDVRTDNKCENSDHYRPWLWVGLVDQKSVG